MAITSRVTTTKAKLSSQNTTKGIIKMAGIQMASGPYVSANLSEAERLIEIAANQGAKLIVLPEYFAIMGLKESDKVAAREEEGKGPIQDFLSKTAKKHKVWLIGGSVPLVSNFPNKVRNSCLVFDDKGKQVARYDKIHLFGLKLGNEHYTEEKTIEAGDTIKVIDSPFGKIGLSICYDLRFPELYRAMGEVNIIVVPSAFTDTTGKAHWESLIRARAIENLSYVIAPAQGGYHISGRETHGNSMIVDPWGVVLDRLPRGSGVVMATMNPKYQESLRKSLPALKHRTIKVVG
ncbi:MULTISPECIES: carbon-nitrogen hydrolase family protein [Methylotenera]|jgi:nitrilase|nr:MULTISPECIES: carbon-nitrogen hydrolase family protein [Methylotenera]MDP3210483.1 carbon-nitrogen hydrolase family protein [Methylotenera sp.]MDP3776827.1 carbon-nitrogen hydrolase family protein [Methylotenera sp.]PPC96991.1 MAG: carbon-nitrogen hydrolase family protein [Methylotenera sp.]PPD48903.1 MAG: carbon-nitrogen hydrolase family protein [Methylotenera sp.]